MSFGLSLERGAAPLRGFARVLDKCAARIVRADAKPSSAALLGSGASGVPIGSDLTRFRGGILRSVVFFNNKGGVGKTTLACNVASQLATTKMLRILLVDCDPQCNTSQLVLDTEQWTDLYWGESKTGQRTLIDLVRPLELGDAGIASGVEPLRASRNRFNIDLLPGHPRMSIIEDLLSRAWSDASGGDIGGLRRTNWVSSLLKEYESRYDLVMFDVGPSLGSLNRTVLVGCDTFVTPMGADIFSLVAIRNIAEWMTNWTSVYATGVSLCEERHPKALENFGISSDGDPVARFAGYTIQQYITKSKKGVRRPTQAFESILSDVPQQVQQHLMSFVLDDLTLDDLRLGDVPNMFSLIPLAQSVNTPISELKAADGLAGGQYQQQQNYMRTIEQVTEALARNLKIA